MEKPDENTRPRGILSKADRRYLRGETEMGSAQSERNTRARIRERIINGVLDFAILFDHLSDQDADLIFDTERDGESVYGGLVELIAFLYDELPPDAFEAGLVQGINLAEAEEGYSAEVDFDVNRRRLDSDELKMKLEQGEELPIYSAIAMFQQRDDISEEMFIDYLEQRNTSEEE